MLDVTEKTAHILKANKKLVDWLLSINVNNRHVKKTHLAWIIDSIDKKEFILTGQGISVSNTGKLIDGQHRLMAIRDAGYPPVEIMVVTGLDEKSRIYVDQNAKRSSADMLKIVLNKSVTSRMTAVLNFHLRLNELKDDFGYTKGKASLDNLVESMAEHADLIDMLLSATGSFGRAGVICGYFHYAVKYNADRAIELAQSVASGENLTKNDPAYKLRERILLSKRSAGGSAAMEDYKYTVTACVADALHQDIQSYRPSSSWRELPPKLGRYVVSGNTTKRIA